MTNFINSVLTNEDIGCVSFLGGGGGNPNLDFRIQLTDFGFFWTNPETDHESIKSTLRVDSSDQIQIRIFLDSQSERFFGKGC